MFVYCIARIRRRRFIGVAIKFNDRIISSFITYNRPFRLEIYHFSNCTFPDVPVWHRNMKSLWNFIHGKCTKILFLTFLRVSGRTFLYLFSHKVLKLSLDRFWFTLKIKRNAKKTFSLDLWACLLIVYDVIHYWTLDFLSLDVAHVTEQRRLHNKHSAVFTRRRKSVL